MATKPPKPALPKGKQPHPRFQSKEKDQTVRAQLSALISSDITPSHYSEYQLQANSETSDRGAAILIATNMENLLEYAIKRQLGLTGKQKDLFGHSGPFGTFDYKIKVAKVIRLIGEETSENLDLIRSIRNVFAHAKIPVKFNEAAITKACSLLQIPGILPPVARPIGWKKETDEELNAIQGRARFVRVCDDTAHNLIVRSYNNISTLDVKNIRLNNDEEIYIMPHMEVRLTPRSLP